MKTHSSHLFWETAFNGGRRLLGIIAATMLCVVTTGAGTPETVYWVDDLGNTDAPPDEADTAKYGFIDVAYHATRYDMIFSVYDPDGNLDGSLRFESSHQLNHDGSEFSVIDSEFEDHTGSSEEEAEDAALIHEELVMDAYWHFIQYETHKIHEYVRRTMTLEQSDGSTAVSIWEESRQTRYRMEMVDGVAGPDGATGHAVMKVLKTQTDGSTEEDYIPVMFFFSPGSSLGHATIPPDPQGAQIELLEWLRPSQQSGSGDGGEDEEVEPDDGDPEEDVPEE